ncbi:response regulator [Devosia sp.]|uniref:response regulator n=1 Tax=Devosia sp. TaxID=1871048 RepID=UPI002B003097|nr:response regulator [Devosia sp.]
MASDPATGTLVIDPSPYMANLVTQMLRHLGRKDIREASSAHQALLELRHRAFALVILDDALEGVDGIELTRRLRADAESPNRHVPVIMMSGAPDARRIAAARDAGVTEFLRKPFAANHLQMRLDAIAAHPRGFVEAETYQGPDRRRRAIKTGLADRRKEG